MPCCTEEGLSCIDCHEAHGKNLNARLFNVGIVREIVLTTHNPVTDPCSTTLQFNNSNNGTNDDANPV